MNQPHQPEHRGQRAPLHEALPEPLWPPHTVGLAAMFTTSVTEQHGAGVAHLVDEHQLAAIRAVGKSQAICGSVFLPAALSSPDGPACALCQAITTARLPSHGRSRPGRKFPLLRSLAAAVGGGQA